MTNYYEILGVDENASDIEIRQAYKKLAVKLHPDKNPGDKFFEDKFKKINEAFYHLEDPIRRKILDAELHKSRTSGVDNSNDDEIRMREELLKRREDELKAKEKELRFIRRQSQIYTGKQKKQVSPFWRAFRIILLLGFLGGSGYIAHHFYTQLPELKPNDDNMYNGLDTLENAKKKKKPKKKDSKKNKKKPTQDEQNNPDNVQPPVNGETPPAPTQ